MHGTISFSTTSPSVFESGDLLESDESKSRLRLGIGIGIDIDECDPGRAPSSGQTLFSGFRFVCMMAALVFAVRSTLLCPAETPQVSSPVPESKTEPPGPAAPLDYDPSETPCYTLIPISLWTDRVLFDTYSKKHMCPACQSLKPKIYITPCFHVLCPECAVRLERPPVCPTCRGPLVDDPLTKRPEDATKRVVEAPYTSREVSTELSLRCWYSFPNLAISCPVTKIQFASWLKHCLSECAHRPVTCSACALRLKSMNLGHHSSFECPARKVPCLFCSEKVRMIDLTQHAPICPGVLVTCPNSCNARCKRSDMAAHRLACHLEVVPCQASHHGCAHKGRGTRSMHMCKPPQLFIFGC
jgi:hypothetical protein